jgi:hypothetical protein
VILAELRMLYMLLEYGFRRCRELRTLALIFFLSGSFSSAVTVIPASAYTLTTWAILPATG